MIPFFPMIRQACFWMRRKVYQISRTGIRHTKGKKKVPFQFKPKLSFNNQVMKKTLANYFHTIFNMSLLTQWISSRCNPGREEGSLTAGHQHCYPPASEKGGPRRCHTVELHMSRACSLSHVSGGLFFLHWTWQLLRTQLHALFSFIFSRRQYFWKVLHLNQLGMILLKCRL